MRPKSPSRRRRWPIIIGLSIVVLLGASFAILRLKFEGPALGSNIASILNKRMRGRIEIGSIEWPTSGLKAALTGGWVPVTARDVRVWDDCALSASTSGLTTLEADELRSGDPNEDCTPDDQPDPDPSSKRKPRKLLLRTDLITAEIDIHALMFGNHDFVFRNVWVYGGEALLEQTREPYPMHAYDRTIVSIVTAFYPRMKPGFRAGIYADNPPPIFDLRDIHVKGLTLMVHTSPYSLSGDNIGYGMTARLDGVDVDADPNALKNDSYLYMDPTDPLIAKFYVRIAVTAKRGNVRILDEGPRSAFRLTEPFPTEVAIGTGPKKRESMYILQLADIELKRLAQLPTEWPRHDNVAKTIEIDATAKTVPCDRRGEAQADAELAADGDPVNPAKQASLHFFGEIQGYWDRPYDGQWNFALDAGNLGPTIRSCIKKKIHGDNLAGRITLTGPFVALPKVGLDLHGMDFDIPLRKDEEPLRLTLAEVHGWVDLVNDQGAIEKTKALVRGGKEPGEVEVSALFAIRPYTAKASVEIIKPIDVARFLPKAALPVGHFLSGRLRANGDVERGFALDEFDLWLGASSADKALRVHKGQLYTNDDFDTIRIKDVNVDAGRNHAAFSGKVSTVTEDVDITINGDFPDLDMWLKRFNVPPLFKSAGGGTIVLRGKYTNPIVTIRSELGGVPCLDKVNVDLTREGDTLVINKVSSAGLGGELTGSGRITLGATKVIDKLHLAGKGLNAAKVCGLGGVAKGTIDAAEVDLHGSIDPNRAAMDWLDLMTNVSLRADKVSLWGDGYSNVRVCVNNKNDAMCRPTGNGYLDADDLSQCEEAKRVGGFCAVTTARRDAGGKLDATIAKIPMQRTSLKKVTPAHLGGTIMVADLPMALINGLVGKPVTGGLLSTTLHLSGAPVAPQAEGAVQLLRAWALGGFLGDPQLAVEPGTINGMSGLKITGKALADRVAITGWIGTAAPYPVEIQLSGRRIELDQFVDLTALVGSPDPIQAWVSGKLTLKTELAPEGGKPAVPDAWIELSELVAVIDHRSTDGRQTPLRLSVIDESPATRAAVSLHVTPTSYELACRDPQAPSKTVPCTTKVATPAGVIVIAGSANAKGVSLTADTTPDHPLELALLASLLDHQFDEVSGHLQLHASIQGSVDKPNPIVELDIDPDNGGVRLRPIGQDVVLRAPAGQIRYANKSLGFNNVQVSIDDPNRKDEQGLVTIRGGIKLDGLTPTTWGLLVEGQIAGKMLLVAAPGVVASASGIAQIGPDGLQLIGRGEQPQLAGTLVFEPPAAPKGKRPPSPIALIPRGTNRELSFIKGTVDIRTCGPQNQDRDDDGLPRCPALSGDHRAYLLDVNDLDISVGGEGHIRVADTRTGKITLRDGTPWKGHVTLDAKNVPYRRQRELDLVIDASNVSLELQNEQSPWHVTGEIAIVNGTYKRNFELTDRLTALASNAPPSKPFWEEYPTMGSAQLDIELNVNRFAVENNIATIELAGDKIAINGTPRDPKLGGTISIGRGEFRLPGTRANFTRTKGQIRFDANVKADNPFIDLSTEADYRDLSGQDHLITLTINGPLAQPPTWDLKTSTGFNKSQTLALLVLGRNPEQLRRSLGDQSLGANPINIDPSTNPSQGITDQLVKDVAGDWVSGLLGSSLTKLTGLDVLRIEVGLGSVGVRVEKKVLENVRLIGDQEWTIRGSTTNGRLELRTPWKIITTTDKISFQGAYLNKNFYDPAETDVQDYQAKLVYKLFIP